MSTKLSLRIKWNDDRPGKDDKERRLEIDYTVTSFGHDANWDEPAEGPELEITEIMQDFGDVSVEVSKDLFEYISNSDFFYEKLFQNAIEYDRDRGYDD